MLIFLTFNFIFPTSRSISDPGSFFPDPISDFFIDSFVHRRVIAAIRLLSNVGIDMLDELAPAEHSCHHEPGVKIPKIIDPMKTIKSQSNNLTFLQSHNLSVSQSIKSYQSYSLTNLTVLQSYSLTILHTVSQSQNLTILQSYTLTISQLEFDHPLTNKVNTRDPIGSKNVK